MVDSYEIHRYQKDTFQYVVATTNKHTEEYVRRDVERFNAILSNEIRSQGIRYVLSTGSTQKTTNKKNIKREKEKLESTIDEVKILSPREKEEIVTTNTF
jgi:succinate dehydrogenase/fumarate reductase flavoprotein subunit